MDDNPVRLASALAAGSLVAFMLAGAGFFRSTILAVANGLVVWASYAGHARGIWPFRWIGVGRGPALLMILLDLSIFAGFVLIP